ncbi:MAG: depupylase/deamidase Dop [Nocardioidaceae bacterium]
MTVRRIMGTETEFGISVLGTPSANPMLTSSQVVNAYASTSQRSRRARWDFEEESPLRDARGFDLSRGAADPSQLTDEEIGLANLILTNGARLYVDHAHPEYSSPECTNPRDIVLWDKAGERIVAAAAAAVHIPGQNQLVLYKNNTDNKGASYGAHENYLMQRSTPFPDIVRHITPFFVSRQVICGAGRVGIGQDGQTHGFQVSQRADYFEVEVGLETTLKRPIVNTRDEPHADPEKYRRLHVIIGDANLAEISTYLKVGTTALVLSMIEDRAISAELAIDSPINELHKISHDPGLEHKIRLKDGRQMTALDLQEAYLELSRTHVEDRLGEEVDDQTRDVLTRWQTTIDKLRRDPMECRRELDWVAKLALLESYRDRDGLEWDDPKLHLIDLQYADLRPDKGLYLRLLKRGSIDRLLTEEKITAAITEPPTDTRAYFRGRCLAQYPERIAAASWDSVIFDLPGRDSLQRIPTMEPARGTRQHVGDLLDRCRTAEELFAAITS